MNAVLLAGLTDTEAAAAEIMIGMTWRDQKCVTLARGLALGVPEQSAQAQACQCCVVDLFGLGMRKHSPDHEKGLLNFLLGRSAVLLVWGNGGGWLECELDLQAGQDVVFLTVPYTSARLRGALQGLLVVRPTVRAVSAIHDNAGKRESAQNAVSPAVGASAPPSVAATTPSIPAWRRALKLADRLKGDRAAFAKKAATLSEPSASPLHDEGIPSALGPAAISPPTDGLDRCSIGLKSGALELLFNAIWPLHHVMFMRLLAQTLQGEDAKLLSTGSLVLVMDVRAGWFASGLPVSALVKLLHTPGLMESLKVLSLPAHRVEQTVRDHLNGRFRRIQKPLDIVAWELVSAALKDVKLEVRADLTFQLRRFPNFTLLMQVDPLDVQLAAICARMPQSIHELTRAFPKHEQSVLRFVTLCIASGLAVVSARAPSAPVPPPSSPPGGVRQGFFKSLLDKLF